MDEFITRASVCLAVTVAIANTMLLTYLVGRVCELEEMIENWLQNDEALELDEALE